MTGRRDVLSTVRAHYTGVHLHVGRDALDKMWNCFSLGTETKGQIRIVLDDPYAKPAVVGNHSHSEPICAHPDCSTFLSPEQMATERILALLKGVSKR